MSTKSENKGNREHIINELKTSETFYVLNKGQFFKLLYNYSNVAQWLTERISERDMTVFYRS